MIPRSGAVPIVAAVLCWVGTFSAGIEGQQRPPAADANAGGLEVLQVRPNFFMIAGAGGNVGVQVGDDGAVVVDAGSAPMAAAVVAEIRKISPRPIRYVIDTGPDADHVGGNEITGIPREATLGGAETMYPEFRKKIRAQFVRPERCRMNCSPMVGTGGNSGPALPPPPPRTPPR